MSTTIASKSRPGRSGSKPDPAFIAKKSPCTSRHRESRDDETLTGRSTEDLVGLSPAGDKVAISWLDNRGDKRTDEAIVA